MTTHQKCGHGKSLDDHCLACEKIFGMDDRFRAHVNRLQALNAELLAALKTIRDHEADAVTDEIDHDIANCPDCKRMEGHPISHGRCNEWYHQHYRIEGKRQSADHRQQYQMRRIAREILEKAQSQ